MTRRFGTAILALSLLASACADATLPEPATTVVATSPPRSGVTPTAATTPGAATLTWVPGTVLAADAASVRDGHAARLAAAGTVWTGDELGRWTPAERVDTVDGTQRVGVVAWKGAFVAWDFGNVIHLSRDGVSWSDARVQPDEGTPSALVPFGDELLLFGSGTKARVGVWRTMDGTTWAGIDRSPAGIVAGASAGPLGLIAVGSTGRGPAAWVTLDGVRWAPLAPPRAAAGEVAALSGVAARDGRVVAIGNVDGAAAVWSSGDLATWSRSAQPARGDELLTSVVDVGGLFVIAGRRHDRAVAWWSVDGLTWASLALPLGANLSGEVSDVVDDNGRVVAFGWTTMDAGNGGSFRTGYLVWTLERGS